MYGLDGQLDEPVIKQLTLFLKALWARTVSIACRVASIDCQATSAMWAVGNRVPIGQSKKEPHGFWKGSYFSGLGQLALKPTMAVARNRDRVLLRVSGHGSLLPLTSLVSANCAGIAGMVITFP